jgi:3-dehydroquinate synthase
LGGGVVTDMGGFAAAAYKRGIDYVNVPTSLMGMVDAAYGGKTGVNFGHLKNMIGVFKQPLMLLIHPPFLQTLPQQHISNGFAEMLKHALLSSNEAVDELIALPKINLASIQGLIQKSLAVKQRIVEKDPNENGLRKVLNLGHTVGHAIEYAGLSCGHDFMHGHAVALGLKAMLKLSEIKMKMAHHRVLKIISFINQNYPTPNWLKDTQNNILEAIQHDKKNNHGQINMVLLCDIGQPQFDVACTIEELEAAIKTI